MLAQLNRKEKIAYSAIASVCLFALSYVGARKARPTPQIAIKELPPVASFTPPVPALQVKEIVVDVEGEVNRPGVYRLPEGSRVLNAIQSAGGPTQEGDTTKLNLAEIVKDGRKIDVPKLGVVSPMTAPEGVSGPAKGRKGAKQMPPDGSIDLNQATAEELEQVPGIGPTTAQKIIDFRTERGRINDVDDLKSIRGLSGKRLEEIRQVFRL